QCVYVLRAGNAGLCMWPRHTAQPIHERIYGQGYASEFFCKQLGTGGIKGAFVSGENSRGWVPVQSGAAKTHRAAEGKRALLLFLLPMDRGIATVALGAVSKAAICLPVG